VPLVTDLLNKTLAAAGKKVVRHLCEHFAYSRQELFQIVKIKRLKTFEDLLGGHGCGAGCEICKPAVASILAACGMSTSSTRSTRRCRTPTIASWPTCSGVGCTPSSPASPAARSRPTN